MEERNVWHVFKRMPEAAGLRRIRIDDLRQTYVSLLLQQGESVVYVKEQRGHVSVQITVDTYGLILGANRAAVDRLDKAATQPGATPAQPGPLFESDEAENPMNSLGQSGEPRMAHAQLRRRSLRLMV